MVLNDKKWYIGISNTTVLNDNEWYIARSEATVLNDKNDILQ